MYVNKCVFNVFFYLMLNATVPGFTALPDITVT